MTDKIETFRALHVPGDPLVLFNIWDAGSAKAVAAAGNPKAVRAAGSANGANNVAVLIPCHRVIRSDGSLGGYAYGLEIKRKLLEKERH